MKRKDESLLFYNLINSGNERRSRALKGNKPWSINTVQVNQAHPGSKATVTPINVWLQGRTNLIDPGAL